MTLRRHPEGILVCVVGPSGAGKDTLIAAAKERFARTAGIAFPRRVVTRPAGAGGEDHLPMTVEAFDAAERTGAFCLSWGSHGHRYGVPWAVLAGVRAGDCTVVNLSRAALTQAQSLGVRLLVLHVTAKPSTLAVRLAGRGRENAAEIAARLSREAPLPALDHPVVEIANDGAVADAIEQFVTALGRITPSADAATGCGSGHPVTVA